jgi:hypothetical protein
MWQARQRKGCEKKMYGKKRKRADWLVTCSTCNPLEEQKVLCVNDGQEKEKVKKKKTIA